MSFLLTHSKKLPKQLELVQLLTSLLVHGHSRTFIKHKNPLRVLKFVLRIRETTNSHRLILNHLTKEDMNLFTLILGTFRLLLLSKLYLLSNLRVIKILVKTFDWWNRMSLFHSLYLKEKSLFNPWRFSSLRREKC